jgi:hypothetical protein
VSTGNLQLRQIFRDCKFSPVSCVSRMPGGAKEERLRAWVRQRLQERGVSVRLAKALGRRAPWVTMYSSGATDADFDTSIKIAAFFRLSLAAIVGEEPLPPIEPVQKIPADIGRAVTALKTLKRGQRAPLIAYVRHYAALRQPESSHEETTETAQAKSNSRGQQQHPREQGRPGRER